MKNLVVLYFSLLLVMPGISVAGAWSWMGQSPVSKFTPEDKKIP